jgi:D-amino-acid oxidase
MNASRRDVLRSLALAGASFAAGCATPPAAERRRLPPVHVAADREIRTVVGLRPFRASGSCVRAGRPGVKLIVHNYGHGGSGVTMSWGTADLAAQLALDEAARNIAVLGAGAVGLATARLLHEAVIVNPPRLHRLVTMEELRVGGVLSRPARPCAGMMQRR